MKRLAMQLRGTALLLVIFFISWTLLLTSFVAADTTPAPLQDLAGHVEQLHKLVERRDWFDIRSYIGGPMHLVRRELQDLRQELPQGQRQEVRRISRRLTDSLVQLDRGAKRFEVGQIESAQAKLERSFQELEQALVG